MPKLVWRVRLVAELEPGVATETEVARIERDEAAGLADLGLRLEEAKRLTAALQAAIVTAQVATVGERRRRCAACGQLLASKGHYRASFRSLFGAVPVRVRRLLVCPCHGPGEPRSFAALDLGGVPSRPSWPTSRPGMRRWRRSAGSRRSCPSCRRSARRSTPARCATGRCVLGLRWCSSTPPSSKTGPRRR